MSSARTIATPYGDARLVTDRARSPAATLLLSHGAGAGIETRDLAGLAAHLPRHGVTVVRLEQPWRVAGRRLATPPPTLDVGLRTAVAALRTRTPLVVGGRSAGARSAARCARAVGAVACLALSFPLHPHGRPERSRLGELLGAGVPTLVVQGERDAMGAPAEFPEDLGAHRVDLAVVPAADHSLATTKRSGLSEDDAVAVVVEAVLEWLVRDVVGSG